MGHLIRVQKLLKELDQAKLTNFNQAKIDEIEAKLEQIRADLSEKESSPSTSYIPYPEYTDPKFIEKIYWKKEFHKGVATTAAASTLSYDEMVQAKCQPSSFKLTPSQVFVKNFMSPHTPYNGILLYHGVGVGKCFALDTPIMMYSGRVRAVQSIRIGDLVMGDDSTPREVLTLARGNSTMYKVSGGYESYQVNQDHVLCLANKGDLTRVTMTVEQFIQLDPICQAQYYGYRTPVVLFETCASSTNENAYIAGSTHELGEGVRSDIINGHVSVRLSFLAGFLDSFGQLKSDVVIFPYEYDVAYIARTVGLVCRQLQYDASHMFLYGRAITSVPFKTIRSHDVYRSKNEQYFRIKVTECGPGNYYGFSVDGNHKFLLRDCTVTHNSCTAISVAEQFADVFSKKCLVLSPQGLIKNFKIQIFSKNRKTQQCTGNMYMRHITDDVNNKLLSEDAINKKISQIINDKYEFLGFQEFGNAVNKLQLGTKNDARFISKIKELYSNRVIIIDEVHNVRDAEASKKKVPPILLKVIQHAENVKLVLLTATPMFNEATEIVWLINLLLANDKRKMLNMSDIFINPKSAQLTPDGPRILGDAIKGYVSYMRGENPFAFPMRLYPSVNGLTKHITYTNPTHDIKGKLIVSNNNNNKRLELFKSYMSDYQKDAYKSVQGELGDNASMSNIELLQISNIAFPGPHKTGEDAFLNCFSVKKKAKSGFVVEYKGKDEFLAPSKIEMYSSKIKTIVDQILGSTGVVFVYSFYIFSGILPMAIALEHMGFARFNNPNILKTDTSQKKYMIDGKQAVYAIIAQPPYAADFHADVEIIKAEANKRGQVVKAIIGSSVCAEGLDFKFIREVHIMEPWWHLNKIEQIVGRAIRNCSHTLLPAHERNVTIYHHVNCIKGQNIESIDEKVYRMAENKQVSINQIENILKSNAVDCALNQNEMYFDPKKLKMKIDVVTSQGTEMKNTSVGDVEGGTFKPITCTGGPITSKPIDSSTFHRSFYADDIQNVLPVITEILQDGQAFTYVQIRSRVPKHIHDDVLMFTLDYMLTHKTPIEPDSYLLYRSNLYMLQPRNVSDMRIPIKDRGPKYKHIQQYQVLVPDGEMNNGDTDQDDTSTSIVEKVTSEVEELKNTLSLDQKFIKVLYDHVIDKLSTRSLLQLAVATVKEPKSKGSSSKGSKDTGSKSSSKSAAKTFNYIIDSLKGAHIIDDKSGWIRDPINHDTWYKIVSGQLEQVSDRELLRNPIPDIKLPDFANLKGFVQTSPDEPCLFKIKMKANSTGGTVCKRTSSFKVDDAIQAILDIDPTFRLEEKLNKENICILYELVLRMNKKQFARPIEADLALKSLKHLTVKGIAAAAAAASKKK